MLSGEEMYDRIKLEARDADRSYEPRPRGIAVHTVLYAQRCDDCGQTYWSRDSWGSHVGCQGLKKGAGF